MDDQTSLDRFQAQSKWEMSVYKSPFFESVYDSGVVAIRDTVSRTMNFNKQPTAATIAQKGGHQ